MNPRLLPDPEDALQTKELLEIHSTLSAEDDSILVLSLLLNLP
jgi:hypothetical protein